MEGADTPVSIVRIPYGGLFSDSSEHLQNPVGRSNNEFKIHLMGRGKRYPHTRCYTDFLMLKVAE